MPIGLCSAAEVRQGLAGIGIRELEAEAGERRHPERLLRLFDVGGQLPDASKERVEDEVRAVLRMTYARDQWLGGGEFTQPLAFVHGVDPVPQSLVVGVGVDGGCHW